MTGRILLAAAILASTACNRPDTSGTSTIAVIPKGASHLFWQSIHAGAEKAARELGVAIIWRGPLREDGRDSQVSEVQGFVSRGVSGIVLAPLDDSALAQPVADAKRRGIPVVVIDSGLKGDDYVSFVATDNRKGGRMAGEHLAAALGRRGKVVLLRYAEGSESTIQREEGFLEALAPAKAIELVRISTAAPTSKGRTRKGRRCSAASRTRTAASASMASSAPTSRRRWRCCACCRTTGGPAR
jgi:ribose transport system substrate-binding protein